MCFKKINMGKLCIFCLAISDFSHGSNTLIIRHTRVEPQMAEFSMNNLKGVIFQHWTKWTS